MTNKIKWDKELNEEFIKLYNEELTIPEIAQKMNLPESSCRARRSDFIRAGIIPHRAIRWNLRLDKLLAKLYSSNASEDTINKELPFGLRQIRIRIQHLLDNKRITCTSAPAPAHTQEQLDAPVYKQKIRDNKIQERTALLESTLPQDTLIEQIDTLFNIILEKTNYLSKETQVIVFHRIKNMTAKLTHSLNIENS